MSHIHWVARQNKLETPKEKGEVNKREVHEYDVRTRDPDAMVVSPTPNPTFKAEALVRVPPTIASTYGSWFFLFPFSTQLTELVLEPHITGCQGLSNEKFPSVKGRDPC
jgi:hypothetical protein